MIKNKTKRRGSVYARVNNTGTKYEFTKNPPTFLPGLVASRMSSDDSDEFCIKNDESDSGVRKKGCE